jgi:hypothetical protein
LEDDFIFLLNGRQPLLGGNQSFFENKKRPNTLEVDNNLIFLKVEEDTFFWMMTSKNYQNQNQNKTMVAAPLQVT